MDLYAYLPLAYIANHENGTLHMVGIIGEVMNNCTKYCLYYTRPGYLWEGIRYACIGEGDGGCVNFCKIKNSKWSKAESRCMCPVGTRWNSLNGECTEDEHSNNAINAIDTVSADGKEIECGATDNLISITLLLSVLSLVAGIIVRRLLIR